MRGGTVPPALLFAALACLLAFAPRGTRVPTVIAAVAAALGTAQLRLPVSWVEVVFLGCWTSTVVTAALVHRPRLLGSTAIGALGVVAGAWAGATVAMAGTTLDLAKAALVFALIVPGAWLVARGWGVAVKVVSSWLIAIALLAAFLPLVPTPGYAPDHME